MHSFIYAAAVLASTLTLAAAKAVKPCASSATCDIRGFDKSPAYDFLNDTISANFDKCSARCNADSACHSFAFGYTQCLLYTQTVASNVNQVQNSPFTFFDKGCGAPSTSSPGSSYSTPVVSSSQASSKYMTSSSYGSQTIVSKTHSSSSYGSPPTSIPTSNGGATHPSPSSLLYPVSSSSSSSRVVPGTTGSLPSQSIPSHPVTSEAPTQSSGASESYTTVITTHYISVCPTGYTTISYTTTVVTASGSDSTPAATSEMPAGFTTDVVVCTACNSASPTVTLTIPVVSVSPVPAPSAGSASAGYSSAGSPAGNPGPAGYTSSVPAGYAPSPATPKSSAPPVTDLSPKESASSPGYSNAVPTIATPAYKAGNSTSSLKAAAPSNAGSKTADTSTGLSGAKATGPAVYTGGASKATEGTFLAIVIGAIWAGLMV